MSRPAKSLSDIWDIYLTYRMAPLPGAGAFMSTISPQGEILDVQDFFRKEFNAVIDQVKADAWDEGQSAGISFQAGGEYIENPYRKQEKTR